MSRMGDLQRRSNELFRKGFLKGQELTPEEAKEASEISCILEIHAYLAIAMLDPGKSTDFFGAFTSENHEEGMALNTAAHFAKKLGIKRVRELYKQEKKFFEENATVISGGRTLKGDILYKIRYKREASKAQEEN